MTATASSTGHPAYTQTLPCEPPSAGEARALVRTALAAWGLTDLIDPGELLVSELVGNAVEHTGCRHIEVTVTRREQTLVRIGVTDRSHNLPVPRSPSDNDVHGRGLMVIEALCERWSADPLPYGKRVWGELRSGGAAVPKDAGPYR